MKSNDVQPFDPERTILELSAWLYENISKVLKKRGAVVGVSGGIDSSVVAALCVRALGANRVLGLALPERDSSPDSLVLADQLAQSLGIELIIEDISAGLEGMGAYWRRDEAIRRLFPDCHPGCAFKITLQSSPLSGERLNTFAATIVDEEGNVQTKRMTLPEYLQIVAASNMKQRLRMTMLYYHAELKNYAVVGTGNKNEHDLGFFVKFGDGASDIMPIVHLLKTSIYQLAEHLQIPRAIIERAPTTDTYPAEVTQEEFFFRVPFKVMDTVWQEMENGHDAKKMASYLHLNVEQVERVMSDIAQKKRTTEFLRMPPIKFRKGPKLF